MPVDYAALKAEIEKDPAGLGYKAFNDKGSDQQIADLLNLPRAGNTFETQRSSVTVNEFVAALDPGEFLSMAGENLQRLQVVLLASAIQINDSNTFVILEKIFQGQTATLSALTALQKREGSRAEVLFGAGVVATVNDISKALRGF